MIRLMLKRLTRPSLLRSVVHPTDFSPAGLDAFAHALRLAVAAKSHFYILHIERETEQADWVQFPRVRETLAAWGMIAPDAPRSAVASELSGLDPHAGVIPRMPVHQNADLLWNRGALTPPKSAAGIVDDANGRHLLRNVQSNKVGHR